MDAKKQKLKSKDLKTMIREKIVFKKSLSFENLISKGKIEFIRLAVNNHFFELANQKIKHSGPFLHPCRSSDKLTENLKSENSKFLLTNLPKGSVIKKKLKNEFLRTLRRKRTIDKGFYVRLSKEVIKEKITGEDNQDGDKLENNKRILRRSANSMRLKKSKTILINC
jgi:hypothetical protein